MAEAELTDLSVRDLLDRLASADPTPGGGAAAALAGALAASLVCMVCNLTLGRDKFAEVGAEVRTILERADGLRARLRDGVTSDAAAYGRVMAALGLPRGDDAEKARRLDAIQAATLEAARVPLEIAEQCSEALALCEDAVGITNPNVVSDVAVAALLAGAGLQAAVVNVEVNLATIKDEAVADALRRRVTVVTAGREARLARVDRQARERT